MSDITKAIDFAKKNPDDPRSVELRRRMEEGLMNPELQAAGLRTFPVKQPERPEISEGAKAGFDIDPLTGLQKKPQEIDILTGKPKEVEEKPTFKEDAITDVTKAGKELASDIGERGENIKNIFKDALDIEKSPISTALQLLGQVAGGAVDVAERGVQAAVTAILPPEFEEGAVEKLNALLETEGGKVAAEAIAGGIEMWDEFKVNNPDLAGNIEAIVNIGELLTVGIGGPIVAKVGKEVVETAVETGVKVAKPVVKETVETAKEIGEATVRRVGEVLDEKRIARIETNTAKVDELVGRIVQGKPEDIAKAKRALTNLDTTDVKTFKELGNAMEDQVEAISKKLDEFLDKQPGTLKSKDLTTTTKVGKEVVKQNFVEDALKQLDELYSTIKDAPARARINQIKQRLDADGLTRREINDLAREYGSQFGRKAFSKLGDPLTSVNAQAFENTRKGIKEAFRNTIEGKVPKELDGKISDLLGTSRLVNKMETRVNQLFQKVKKRGLLKRISQKLGTAVDVATFGTVSGFISRLLPSNVGLKTMNALDIEQELAKNLKLIDKLSDTATDDEIVNAVVEMMKNINKSQAGLSVKPITASEFGAKLLPDQIDTIRKFVDNPPKKPVGAESFNIKSLTPDQQKAVELMQSLEPSLTKNADLTRFAQDTLDELERAGKFKQVPVE